MSFRVMHKKRLRAGIKNCLKSAEVCYLTLQTLQIQQLVRKPEHVGFYIDFYVLYVSDAEQTEQSHLKKHGLHYCQVDTGKKTKYIFTLW